MIATMLNFFVHNKITDRVELYVAQTMHVKFKKKSSLVKWSIPIKQRLLAVFIKYSGIFKSEFFAIYMNSVMFVIHLIFCFVSERFYNI